MIQRKKEAFDKKAESGGRRGLTSNIWQDVTVKISKGRGDHGMKISEADFRSWLDVAIDIEGPQSADIVQTDHGDLILDKQFSGRIYLKGLRVLGLGPDGKGFIFGYSFVRGRINRDRERLVNRSEEAEMLAMIWEQSIVERGDGVTDNYIKLFRDHQECADIASAEEKVSISTAKAIWNRLTTASPNVFFYSENDSESDTADQVKCCLSLNQVLKLTLYLKSSMITVDLKKRPEKLPKALWKILRKFSLARTPLEERIHLFQNSETIGMNEDPFCVSVLRALSASLSLDRRMKDVKVKFVKGGDTGIDLLFREEENLLRVHEKWIHFQRIHEGASCEVSRLARERSVEMEAFSCDHIVEDLFELALNDIRGALKLDRSECVTLRRVARERIQQIPRLIKVFRTGRANELEVSWTGNESGIISKKYGANIRYHVILHKVSTCWSKRGELLHQAGTYTSPGGGLQNF